MWCRERTGTPGASEWRTTPAGVEREPPSIPLPVGRRAASALGDPPALPRQRTRDGEPRPRRHHGQAEGGVSGEAENRAPLWERVTGLGNLSPVLQSCTGEEGQQIIKKNPRRYFD